MHPRLEPLLTALDFILKNDVDISKKTFTLTNFKEKKTDYYRRILESEMKKLETFELSSYATKQNIAKAEQARKHIDEARVAYLQMDLPALREHLFSLQQLHVAKSVVSSFVLPPLPFEIQSEVIADAKELEQCFENGLYRSAIILSGRILETCLHRTYYDLTGKDILETSPGIGLGNLIAKLRDVQYSFPPGLSEQIHLINQVRIYSVHKKQETFIPTREQTHAIMLFTLDVLKKLFEK